MRALLLMILLLAVVPVYACPFCSTDSAVRIRALLFGPDFYFNLGISIVPFIIFAIIVYLIYRGGLSSSKNSKL